MKHTEGWIVTESGHRDFQWAVVAEDGGSVCHISNWFDAKEKGELIAKAPEMLELLNWFVAVMNEGSLIVFTDDDQHKSVKGENEDNINKIESLVSKLVK